MSDDFTSTLDDHLKALFNREIAKAPTMEAKQLLDRLQTLVLRGGKRARPKLLALTYNAYGGKKPSELIDLAVALELHHQFLLAHDDVIDADNVRYNGPNIIGYYEKEYKASNQQIPYSLGLLAGDLLFTLANQAILNSKRYTDLQKLKLLSLMHDTNARVIYGQQLDSLNVDLNIAKFDIKKLELIDSLKTATYSIGLPMQCAAIMLNLPKSERQKIDKFALPLGVLFQLVDDYSDYFNNSSVFNNSPKYRDLQQGKITYPIYIATKLTFGKDLDFLKHCLGNKNLSANEIKKAVSIMRKCRADKESIKFIEPYFKAAFRALDELAIDPASSGEFIKLIENYRLGPKVNLSP